MTGIFLLKQLDYSLSMSMHDSWFGLHPRQLSCDRNLNLIIQLFNGNTSGSLGEWEMLWEYKQLSAAFLSSPKLSQVFL